MKMNIWVGCMLSMLSVLGLATSGSATAFDLGISKSPAASVPVTARVAFTPQDDVAGQIADAVRHARRQVLVQAYSFTHGEIAQALIEAHRRGVEVKLIADREQTENMEHGQVTRIAAAGVPVWLDGEHQSAHNKIIVIDAGTASALVITGSFNFTKAAQNKNAENVVFLGGSDKLADAYARNWQAHLVHSQPLRIH